MGSMCYTKEPLRKGVSICMHALATGAPLATVLLRGAHTAGRPDTT